MAGPDEEIRAFVAIDLPAQVKAFLQKVGSDLKKAGADVKWTRPEGTHLTLKFLGNIRSGLVPAMEAQLMPAFSNIKPFTLSLRGLGAFPSLGRPRVFWVGVHDSEQALAPLARQIEPLLEPLGFAPEKRPFSPHLTLGRVRSNKHMGELIDQVRQDMELAGPAFVADHAVLFKSILKPSGAEYRALVTFPFSGR